MPLNVVRHRNGTVQELRIKCEHCAATTNDREIAKNGSLLVMGWTRRFNAVTRHQEYFCPKHKELMS